MGDRSIENRQSDGRCESESLQNESNLLLDNCLNIILHLHTLYINLFSPYITHLVEN